MIDSVFTKFKVGSVTDFGNDNHNIKMSPVTNDNNLNKSFSMYTPSGSIEMHITNPNCIGFFEAGKEYYVEFKKA